MPLDDFHGHGSCSKCKVILSMRPYVIKCEKMPKRNNCSFWCRFVYIYKPCVGLGGNKLRGTTLWLALKWVALCRAPMHEECPHHHGHKGGPRSDIGISGIISERAQVILVWMRVPGVGNIYHPRKLGGMRVRPSSMSSLWHAIIECTRTPQSKVWQFEWGVIPEQHPRTSMA